MILSLLMGVLRRIIFSTCKGYLQQEITKAFPASDHWSCGKSNFIISVHIFNAVIEKHHSLTLSKSFPPPLLDGGKKKF